MLKHNARVADIVCGIGKMNNTDQELTLAYVGLLNNNIVIVRRHYKISHADHNYFSVYREVVLVFQK
jgi:hypothetical protein